MVSIMLTNSMFILLWFFYIRMSATLNPLQIGNNDYLNTKIEVTPIRTLVNGLCYKFKMPGLVSPWQFLVSSSTLGVDKIEKLDFYVASDNTWQGVIINNWPYSNTPLLVRGVFSTKTTSAIFVDMDENIWKYRKGISDFDECMNNQPMPECVSILDPRPNR